jgi:hypothetical protein
MKKFNFKGFFKLFPASLIAFMLFSNANAAVVITPATGGGGLCAGVYTTLGNIVITEGANTDFGGGVAQNNVTLILTAPAGYDFQPGVGAVSFTGTNLTSATLVVTASTITVTFSNCAGGPCGAVIDVMTISGIKVKASAATPIAAPGNILRTAASPGTGNIIGIVNGSTNFGSLTQGAALTYSSSTTASVAGPVNSGSTNNAIIGIQVVTNGICGTFNLTQLNLDVNGGNGLGTDNAAIDISNAKIYYTGTSATFAAVAQFGSTVVSPTGTFNVTGSQAIQAGTNYFWLTYDIPVGATSGNRLDAQCTQLTFDAGVGVQIPTLTNPAGSRTIAAPNVFTVGASRTYFTIQAAYNALPAVIANGYVIEVYGDYNPAGEVYPVNFVNKSSGSFTITIRPAAGVAGLVATGDPGTNAYLFNYNGAQNVIFDGRPGGIGAVGDFAIRNKRTLATIGGAYSFINDAAFNELKYLKIEADAASPNSIILFSTTTGTTGNSNNNINNSIIQDLSAANGGTAALPFQAVYSSGTAAKVNSTNTIDNCQIVDVYNPAAATSANISIQANNDSWIITNNHFYQTANYAAALANAFSLINVTSGGGYTVTGNFIGGKAPSCGGTAFTVTSGTAEFDGIKTNTLTGATNTISGNTIANLAYTTTSTAAIFPFVGIVLIGSANFNCGSSGNGNTIGSTTTTGSITLTNNGTSGSFGFVGINCSATGTTSITYNSIGGIILNGTRIAAETDLILSTGATGTVTVDNNILGNNVTDNIVVASNSPFNGIYNTGGGGITATNNIIRNINHSGSTTSAFNGIFNISGPLVCTGNTISNISFPGNAAINVISHSLGTTAIISSNSINTISVTNAGVNTKLISIYSNTNTPNAVTCNNNTIGSTASNNIMYAGNSYLRGIYKDGTGNLTCNNNIIQEMNLTNTGTTTEAMGIGFISGTTGVFTASGNTIKNINSASTISGLAIYGIYCQTTSTTHLITKNIIQNLNLNTTGAISMNVIGIYVNVGNGVITKNSITGLTCKSTSTVAEIDGIYLSSGSWDIFNNLIIIDNGANLNSIAIDGINILGTGTMRIHHNTVKVAGTVSAGTANTACLWTSNTGAKTINNNIFQNLRTGTGSHYAFQLSSTTGLTINYNYDEVANNQSQVCFYTSNNTFAQWKTNTGANKELNGTTTLDVNGIPSNPFIGAGAGTNLSAIVPDDRFDVTRAIAPWMGAYEGPTIITAAVSPLTFCQGATVNVPYTITGTFVAGNIFTAQLSDAAGSFAAPSNIGTLASQVAGTIATTIPAAQPIGTLYRIRVVSSNPVINGSDNGANLSVSSGAPGAFSTDLPSGVTCAAFTAKWFASANALTYYLDVSTVNTFATFVPGFNNLNVGNVLSYNVTGLNSGTNYYYRERAENGCGLVSSSGFTSTNTTGTPQTYIVSSLADGTTVDGISLRWAITQANANCGHDFIKFNLGAAGPYTIALTTVLPNLTDNAGVTIDGWSNTGNNGTPNTIPVFNTTGGTPMNPIYKVIITSSVTNGGINIASDNNIIQGLAIYGVGGNSVLATDIAINIISGTNNSILGNYLGMNVNGVAQGGTSLDIGILVSGTGNMIGDGTAAGANLIAGLNNFSGIRFTGAGSTLNSVKGNILGIQANGGTQVAGNAQIDGIRFLAGSGGGNTIGGLLPGEGNVISGNLYGIFLAGTSATGNTIVGNIIGPQANGTTMVPSNAQVDGIWISGSQNNIIGGNTPGARNIISANSGEGIYMELAGSSGNLIKGNYIGLDKTGTTFIATSSQNIGIWISAAAGGNNIIGGTGAGEGNVISGNYDQAGTYSMGLHLSSTLGGTSVLGNIIGTQKDGVSYVAGNLQDKGINFLNCPNNIIGGNTAGARNVISGNETFGMVIGGAGSTGNIIKGNYIGIDLTGTTMIASSTQNTGILVNTDAGSGTIIGGTGANEGNLISGQSGGGVLNGCGINIVNTAGGTSVIGNIVGPQKNGITYLAANNQVYGVLINGSPNNIIGGSTAAARNILSANEFYGFQVDGAASTGNIVKGNYIGIDQTGTSFITGSTQNIGVYIQATCGGGNTIGGSAAGEGNVISGNYDGGLTGIGINIISTAAAGNTVIGNIIGPQADGNSYVASNLQYYGIEISASPNNIIGGSVAGAGNIISANENSGIFITGATSTANLVKGNYIGIAKNGTSNITGNNQENGVIIGNSAANNTIGGTAPGEGNVISGNSDAAFGTGVNLFGSATTNTIVGNIIGPQSNGTSFLASTGQIYGLYIADATNNNIGGTSTGQRNIISANQTYGFYITGASTGNNIKGNYIGSGSTLSSITSSSQDYGVYIVASGANNNIGGSIAGEANIIAFNTVNGLYLTGLTSTGNRISRNPIYKNTGKQINLNYGPSQANGGFAVPVITSASITTVSGTAPANSTVEVFNSATSNNCFDAQTYLGTTTAAAGGAWSLATTLAVGDTVIATATAAASPFNTSEFSNCFPVLAAQTITTSAIAPTTYCQGATVSVAYTISGTFVAGNVFTAQLSDAAGGFSAPVSIGTLASTVAGTITATIPGTQAAGAAYRIRVVGSNPVTIGTDNGTNLTVIATRVPSVAVAITTGSNPMCAGASTTFTATPTNGGISPTYQWKVNGVNTFSTANFTTSTLVNGDVVTVVLTPSAEICPSPATATSPAITMTVNPIPATPAVTTNSPLCIGGTLNLSTALVGGATYTWSGPNAFSSALQNPTRGPLVLADAGTYGVTVTVSGCTSAQGTGVLVITTPAVFTVINVNDAGAGSFRQAIINANANCGHDTVKFNMGAGGPFTITLASALPNLTDNAGVTIDGFSQTGSSPNTIPVFNTTGATPMNPVYQIILGNSGVIPTALILASDNNVIQGLVMQNFGDGTVSNNDIAITITGSNNQIIGNNIGMDATGIIAGTNTAEGVMISSGTNNIIGNGTAAGANLISGLNSQYACIDIFGTATGTSIKGNMIGLQKDGTTKSTGALSSTGVRLYSAPNTVGGANPGEGNVISGRYWGVLLGSTNGSNSILGNIIGTQANGTTYVASNPQDAGIYILGSSGAIIGGNVAGARNIISGNETSGITISGTTSTGNLVKGNYIGIDKTGVSYITGTSQDYGIYLSTAGGSNIIGGSNAGDGNVISGNSNGTGNSYGVYLSGGLPGNSILGNIIGPQANGTTYVVTNGQAAGIYINNSASHSIGGITAGARNIISANKFYGISINGVSSAGNIVIGNYIGLDKTGTSFITGSSQIYGVSTSSPGGNNIIGGSNPGEGNVISGNSSVGVQFNSTGTSSNSILGNIIGPQANGTSVVASNAQGNGIVIYSSNDIIGGNSAGARNIISGNNSTGISFNTASAGNIVKGNYIGLDKNGINIITGSTQSYGIFISSTGGNTIGGINPGEGNVVSGNTSFGFWLSSTGLTGNTFLGNIIGPQADGTSYVVSNSQSEGFFFQGNSSNNIIGGNSAGARNIISGNTSIGLSISGTSSGNIIKGNYIGPSSSLLKITGASQAYGIYIQSSAANNIIGGITAGEANTIAYNTVNGLYLTSLAVTGNKISGNPVYRNTGKPINLNYGASQANNGMAFPVITLANATIVSGTAPANANVEVFLNNNSNSCFDAVSYLGTAAADGAGNWSLAVTVAVGDTVLATATDAGNNTSEFSSCVPILGLQSITTSAIAPTLLCRGGSFNVSYTITGAFVAGNIFTAQLSDAAGSFAAPVSIGTLASTIAGTIPVTIPVGTASGVAFRIRVAGSNPATTGTDNGTNLTVSPNGGAGTWTWTGAISTSWFDPCNWDKKCLPDLSSDVIIPSGMPVNPLITGAIGTCRTIQIQASTGAKVTVDTTTGGKLQVTQ